MYPKHQLLQQQIPQLPKQRTDAIYRVKGIEFIMKSRLAMSGKLLIAAFYSRESAANGFSLPSAVLFQTKKEYITLVNGPDGQQWKECRLPHALGNDYNKEKQVISLTERDEGRVRSFLPINLYGSDPPPIHRHIEKYQDGILGERLAAKKKQRAAAIDERMKDTPPLPAAFARWIDRVPLLHSRYIYYRRVTSRKAECFCTHCKTGFTLTTAIPVHNHGGVCPSCNSEITYKAIGKSMKVSDESHAVILQKARDGSEYILRYFEVSRGFWHDYRQPEDRQYEKARLFLTADGTITGQFKNGWSARTGRHGWHPTKDIVIGKNKEITWQIQYGMYQCGWNVWFRPAHLYSHNLRSMLTGLNLSYDIIGNIKGRALDVTSYLMRSMTYPFAPSLRRIGLPRLCGDLLEESYEPTVYHPIGALHMRFGVDKAFLALMREHDLGVEAIRLRVSLHSTPEDEDFLWMLENKANPKEVAEILKHTTFHRMKKYIERQSKDSRISTYGDETKANKVIGFWKDYLSMCGTLGYDLTMNGRRLAG